MGKQWVLAVWQGRTAVFPKRILKLQIGFFWPRWDVLCQTHPWIDPPIVTSTFFETQDSAAVYSCFDRQCHQWDLDAFVYRWGLSTRWLWYCWWKKSCTSWYDEYPIIYRVLYIPGGQDFFHQQYLALSLENPHFERLKHISRRKHGRCLADSLGEPEVARAF